MDNLITFALDSTAKAAVLTERQRDKLLIKILLKALQGYMNRKKLNK